MRQFGVKFQKREENGKKSKKGDERDKKKYQIVPIGEQI
jgi:hypothetical protein